VNIAQILSQLVAIAKTDLNKQLLPIIAAFFSSIATNPTALNITQQLAKAEVDLLAALPSIGQDVLAQLAGLVNAQAQTLLATAVAPAVVIPATTATVHP
jgi:hypothetical protein